MIEYQLFLDCGGRDNNNKNKNKNNICKYNLLLMIN